MNILVYGGGKVSGVASVVASPVGINVMFIPYIKKRARRMLVLYCFFSNRVHVKQFNKI